MNVVFMCVAGKQYGFGHVGRCKRIADALNAHARFVVDAPDNHARIMSYLAPYAVTFANKLSQGKGVTVPDVVVADVLSRSLVRFKNRAYPLIALDNYYSGAEVYVNIQKKTFKATGKVYTGTDYWAIDEPKRRKKWVQLRKVLVTFGYSDPACMTEKVIPQLLDAGLDITCLVTPLFGERRRALRKLQVTVKEGADVQREMLRADVCITGGGNTLIESIAHAVPCIVVPFELLNAKLARTLSVQGYCLVSSPKNINNFLHEPALRAVHTACLRYNGYGLHRLCTIIRGVAHEGR